jgi:methionyl-tRNA formyltransferase
MKAFFFGSSAFSVPSLEAIRSSVSHVVTKRAKPKGRGYLLEDNEVKQAAARLGIPLIEIDSFKEEAAREAAALKPDLLVVASFGLIIPKWFLEVPAVGAINVHPSLLPRYRGPSPVQWVLWNGERETAITIIKMSERMDAGNILYQEAQPIAPDDDAASLMERLARRSGEIVPGIVSDIAAHGMPEGTVQDDAEATFTPIITKEMGHVDWNTGSLEVVRQVRALALWPTAYTNLDGQLLKVSKASLTDGPSGEPGQVLDVTKEGIVVAAADGPVVIVEVQLQGRKRMRAYEFGKGYRNLVGKKLT